MNRIEPDEDGTLILRGRIGIKEMEYEWDESIKKIIIGSSVKTIGENAFRDCHNVSELILKNLVK